jgi:hypothetical protein
MSQRNTQRSKIRDKERNKLRKYRKYKGIKRLKTWMERKKNG